MNVLHLFHSLCILIGLTEGKVRETGLQLIPQGEDGADGSVHVGGGMVGGGG